MGGLKPSVLILVLALALGGGQGPTPAAAQPTDTQLLQAFKATVSFDSYNNLASWNSANCCDGTWKGVTCDSTGRVIDIRMNGVKGTIPANGWALPSSLKYLFLNGNWLKGTLPANWDLPAGLTDIYINNNRLDGTLPEWSDKPNLRVFIKPGNAYLCGVVPATPRFIDAWGANFTLPPCKTDTELLTEFRSTLTFDAWNSLASWKSSNACDGTWSGVTCKNGRVVAIRMNGVKGQLPSGPALPSSLQTAFLNGNWFSGSVNGNLALPPALTDLWLSGNNFEGTLPSSWSYQGDARIVIYPGNAYICGSWPQFPEYYTNMGQRLWSFPACKTDAQLLLAFKASVSDPNGSLSNWTADASTCTWDGITCTAGKVTMINLSGMGLSGTITPASWFFPASVTHLFLNDNSFSGGLPAYLNLPPNLAELWINGNSFTGALPTYSNMGTAKVFIKPGNTGLCGSGGNVPQYPAYYSASGSRLWTITACPVSG